jgi:hypothetical protein
MRLEDAPGLIPAWNPVHYTAGAQQGNLTSFVNRGLCRERGSRTGGGRWVLDPSLRHVLAPQFLSSRDRSADTRANAMDICC